MHHISSCKQKNQQCFFGCVSFLMMLIQHYWSVYWSVWLQKKYLVSSTPHFTPALPVMPPSAVSGRESDHYHTASFTSLHFSISITHLYHTNNQKKEEGKERVCRVRMKSCLVFRSTVWNQSSKWNRLQILQAVLYWKKVPSASYYIFVL